MEKSSNDNDIVSSNNFPNEVADNGTIYTEETLNNLKDGLLQMYQPKLESVKSQLNELTNKQNILIEQLHNENLKLALKQNSEEYQEMFRKIQAYKTKLINIKSEMRTLHDRSQKLVKRSVRLQNLKEKDDQEKQEQREKELNLIASNK